MQSVVIIDYGMGNLGSVANAVQRQATASQQVTISADAKTIAAADRIIFPGQGAGKACMQALRDHQLVETITDACQNKMVLGICMGLQVLMNSTEENAGVACLGVFEGEVKAFRDVQAANNHAAKRLKIPQMGWNQVKQMQNHALWQGIADQSYFYFVHSFYVKTQNTALIAGSTHYGIDYVSALGNENVFAVQFHPEKSAQNGLRLLANFLKWNL